MNYYKFFNNRWGNNPFQFKQKGWPCPGNIPHRMWAKRNNQHMSMKLFDKYVGGGHKKYQLYWRTHEAARVALTRQKW